MRGLIVAAGYGTRFLPVTKSVPKEMLPLIDKPSISFIVDELLQSGIKDIAIITSRRKKALEDYFDREMELEGVFAREGEKSAAKLKALRPPDCNITFVRQKEMLGTGHALLLAEPWLRGEPFIAAYPDDLHFGSPPLAAQLMETYKATLKGGFSNEGACVLATLHDPPDLHRYGVLKLEQQPKEASAAIRVTDIIEKPAPGTEPSREASIGRYLYTPEIFHHLKKGWELHQTTDRTEYFHTFALKEMMKQGNVVYAPVRGERLDIGTPEGYLRAILRYASMDPKLKEIVTSFTCS